MAALTEFDLLAYGRIRAFHTLKRAFTPLELLTWTRGRFSGYAMCGCFFCCLSSSSCRIVFIFIPRAQPWGDFYSPYECLKLSKSEVTQNVEVSNWRKVSFIRSLSSHDHCYYTARVSKYFDMIIPGAFIIIFTSIILDQYLPRSFARAFWISLSAFARPRFSQT